MAIEAEALATEHFLVLCGQIVGNREAGFEVVYSWDGQIHTSRQEAIASGLQSLGSDDFSIGVIRDGRLASLDWMNEPKDESLETLREIEEQIDWEDPRNTFAVCQEADALKQGGDETDFEWLRRLRQHFSADLIHRSALAEDTARAAEDGRWHVTARDGKPRYDGEGERWLQTWSEASATYDIACIDGDWSYGQEVDLLGMDAWRWLAPWPGALAPALPLDKEAADANR